MGGEIAFDLRRSLSRDPLPPGPLQSIDIIGAASGALYDAFESVGRLVLEEGNRPMVTIDGEQWYVSKILPAVECPCIYKLDLRSVQDPNIITSYSFDPANSANGAISESRWDTGKNRRISSNSIGTEIGEDDPYAFAGYASQMISILRYTEAWVDQNN